MEKESKKYIRITVVVDKDGTMTPKEILWEDGRVFPIRRVLDRKHVITAAGGAAVCYVCLIGKKRKELYREKDRWYILTKSPLSVMA